MQIKYYDIGLNLFCKRFLIQKGFFKYIKK